MSALAISTISALSSVGFVALRFYAAKNRRDIALRRTEVIEALAKQALDLGAVIRYEETHLGLSVETGTAGPELDNGPAKLVALPPADEESA